MVDRLIEFVLALYESIFPSEERPAAQPKDYFTIVEEARQDWQGARKRFEQISDPDLVDHAIYALEAAERRYVYLLKKAREEGADIYTISGGG